MAVRSLGVPKPGASMIPALLLLPPLLRATKVLRMVLLHAYRILKMLTKIVLVIPYKKCTNIYPIHTIHNSLYFTWGRS